jgi:hypothetical protein
MTEAKIQALVDRGLLRLKAEVEWKAPTGEAFLTEDVKDRSSSVPSLSAGSTSPLGISSKAFSYTTSWSWYTSSPTQSQKCRPSFIFVRRIWGYRLTSFSGGTSFA